MIKTTTIALLGKDFVSWAGGIEFLRFCVNAMALKSLHQELKIFLLIPEDLRSITKLKNILRPLRNILLKGKRQKQTDTEKINRTHIIDSFNNIDGRVEIIFYKDSYKGLVSCLKRIKADVVLPAVKSLGRKFPIPWVGYIYDFQHRYYPSFFRVKDCKQRDFEFQKMLLEAKAVIVNSMAVKKDIKKFYPDSPCRIFNLPFAPMPIANWFEPAKEDIIQKYGLPKDYFMISNQFWVHKSHITAFEALSYLNKNIEAKVSIVCTGKTHDSRFPEYFGELQEKCRQLGINDYIHFLGYIPKNEQIQIMRNAIAVIQPTLFEGGLGGGAIYDAVAIGVPAVVSDIPINLEIEDEDVLFFKTGEAEDLADKMLKTLNMDKERIPRDILEIKGRQRAEELGEALLEAIAFVSRDNT